MKKLITVAFAIIISSVMLNAQTKPGYKTPSAEQLGVTNENFWNYQYTEMLKTQNKFLNYRKIALIISASGVGVTVVGSIIGPNDSNAGAAITIIGGITTLTGGIWCLVNEFNLIKTQKAINEHLTLKYNPGSLALTF